MKDLKYQSEVSYNAQRVKLQRALEKNQQLEIMTQENIQLKEKIESLEPHIEENQHLKRRYSKLLKTKSKCDDTINAKEKLNRLERACSNERVHQRESEIDKLKEEIEMKNELLKGIMKERD